MRHYYYGLLLLVLPGCAKVKHEVKSVLVSTVDVVWPVFDSQTPDTKYNQQRFKHFAQVDITPDVKNIYCSADRIGIDATFQFSFNCNSQTAQRIIAANKLVAADSTVSGQNAIGIEYNWWNIAHINSMPRYYRIENDWHRYFWYDTASSTAWLLDFDM